MLTALLLLHQLPATGMIQMGPRSILTYTTKQAEDAQWSAQPRAEDIAATEAAHIPGGARVAMKCSANKLGDVTQCDIVAAEPDRPEVRASALKMAPLYHLDADGTQKVRWSQTPPMIWMQIMFPDKQGRLPSDCDPAFGCLIEHLPPPPPPPPSSSNPR